MEDRKLKLFLPAFRSMYQEGQMYCWNCGKELEEAARYCSVCGAAKSFPQAQSEESRERKPLSRMRKGRRIAGVCAGVARYFDLDVTLVRIVWILVTIFPPIPGLVAYIVCWIAMPEDPLPSSSPEGDVQPLPSL
jgi:phage shock protein C